MSARESIDVRREGRLLSALLMADLGFGLAQLGLLILTEGRSIVSLVATMAGNPTLVAGAFFVLAVLLVPYLVMQMMNPSMVRRLKVVRLTVHVLMAAGVLRIFLAYTSRNMEADTMTAVLAMNGVWCIAMSAWLAYSINNKQKRDAA